MVNGRAVLLDANGNIPAFAIGPYEWGVGTVELQYQFEYDPDGPGPLPAGDYWRSIPWNPHATSAGGIQVSNLTGPVVCRFMSSRLHIPPQYADQDANNDGTADDPVLAKDPYPQFMLGATPTDPLSVNLTRPVFLIGYAEDGNRNANGALRNPGNPEDYHYFPLSPGHKSPDQLVQVITSPGTDRGKLSVEPVGRIGCWNEWVGFWGRPPNLFAEVSPKAFSWAARTGDRWSVSVQVPSFQPPTSDAWDRDNPTGTPSRIVTPDDRYNGLWRMFVDGPGGVAGQWDVQPYRGNRTSTDPDKWLYATYEQFDQLIDEQTGNPFQPASDAPGYLVEDYDTFGVQFSVKVVRDLWFSEKTLDLGAFPGGGGSAVRLFQLENRSNVPLLLRAEPPDFLYRVEAETGQGVGENVTSPGRRLQMLPLPIRHLYLTAPDPNGVFQDLTQQAVPLGTSPPGSVTGQLLNANLRAGEGITPLPVPLGQPAGTYSGRYRVFEDHDQNGFLSFNDRNGNGVRDEGEEYTEKYFDFEVKLTVVEGPLGRIVGLPQGLFPQDPNLVPFNNYLAPDATPAALFVPGADRSQDRLYVAWASNRTPAGDTPPGPNDPWNIYIARADGTLTPYHEPTWDWRTATAITQETAAPIRNLYPWVARDQSNTYWLFYHQEGPDPNNPSQFLSRLRYWKVAETPQGVQPTEVVLPDSRVSKQRPRGVVDVQSANSPVVFLFWHAGPAGATQLFFNAFIDLGGGQVQDWGVGTPNLQDYRVQTTPALAYVKDVSVWPWYNVKAPNSGLDEVDLYYTGQSLVWQNEDIYWSRYDVDRFRDGSYAYAANGRVARLPWGRIPFGRIMDRVRRTAQRGWVLVPGASAPAGPGPGDRLTPSAGGLLWAARHPDWYTTPPNTQPVAPDGFPYQFLPDDPVIYLARPRSDLDAQGNLKLTALRWDQNVNTRRSFFDATRGEYVLALTGGDGPLSGPLQTLLAAGHDLHLRLNPTLGTVAFSHNLSQLLGEEVEVYADYTSGTLRITDDPASDAEPVVAIDEWGRRMLVWHRSPNEETSQLWYKIIAYAIQVNAPPVSAINAVQEYYEDASGTPFGQPLKGGWALRPLDVDANNNPAPNNSGIIFLDPLDEGKKVEVEYRSANGALLREVHDYPGLVGAVERPVPAHTVAHETQVALAPERFWLGYDDNGVPRQAECIRYWLFWVSTREVFDADPGVTTHPYRSGDLYYQALNPVFPTGSPR